MYQVKYHFEAALTASREATDEISENKLAHVYMSLGEI